MKLNLELFFVIIYTYALHRTYKTTFNWLWLEHMSFFYCCQPLVLIFQFLSASSIDIDNNAWQ